MSHCLACSGSSCLRNQALVIACWLECCPFVLQSKDVVGKAAFVVKGVCACAYEDDEEPCQDMFDLHFR